jgi:hypothetical protein
MKMFRDLLRPSKAAGSSRRTQSTAKADIDQSRLANAKAVKLSSLFKLVMKCPRLSLNLQKLHELGGSRALKVTKFDISA